MKNNSNNFLNIKQDEKNNIKMNDVIENQFKQIRKHCKEIKEYNLKNLIIKIFLIILLSIFQLSFNLLNLDLSLTKEIKKYKNVETKNKIITIGFYDVIHCTRKWRRVKKGYFYDLPKYINKFRWVFLAKKGVE